MKLICWYIGGLPLAIPCARDSIEVDVCRKNQREVATRATHGRAPRGEWADGQGQHESAGPCMWNMLLPGQDRRLEGAWRFIGVRSESCVVRMRSDLAAEMFSHCNASSMRGP